MTSPVVGLRTRPLTYAGLFVVTLSTLAYEIVLTRIFSVTMWYHFAFVAISVALFGTTAGALIVHLRPERFTDDKVKRQMAKYALAYAASISVAFAGQLALPFRIEANAGAMASVVLTCVLISVPFVCAGVVVCLALTRFGDEVNRLYAADLIGAGLGCLGLVVAFNYFDGPSLVILVASVAALGGLLLAIDAGSRGWQVLGVLITAFLLLGAFGNRVAHERGGNAPIKILYTKDQRDTTHLSDRWNAFSRLTVDGNPNATQRPFGNGLSTEMPEDTAVHQLNIVIDSTAGTVMTRYTGDPDETDFLRYDISNLVYDALEPDGIDHAAVIGVGGGRDVLSALEYGADNVTGIEINGNMLDLLNDEYGEFTGHLDRDPRVNFANDEARSFLTRSDDEFDAIQISLIDTWAATGAGAFALSENSLYTTEAWDTFLDKLQPDGILSVSRWFKHENPEPLEVLRTTALAAETLRDRGVENPRDHILIFEGPGAPPYGATVGTILVSPEPYSQDVLDTVTERAEELRFEPVLTPDFAMDEFPFADLVLPDGQGPRVSEIDADISPPTDNRPFFFQMAEVGTVIKGLTGDDVGSKQVFRPVITLAALGFAVLLIAGICIGGPLVQIGRRTTHRGRVPYYLYFCGIGLGFLMVEISQMMRLSTFLGHPTYSLTVVLFTVLLFSGLGSMVVGRFATLDRPRTLLVPLIALLGLAVVFGLLTPQLIEQLADQTRTVRIGAAVGLLAPLAFLMGMPFSLGMRMASTDETSPTAFLWGINGAMSVVSSVFATVIALFFGIYIAFSTGVLAYVLATVSMWVLIRRLPATAAESTGTDSDADVDTEADADPDAEDAAAADEEPEASPPADGSGDLVEVRT
jgi:hypothetical protein